MFHSSKTALLTQTEELSYEALLSLSSNISALVEKGDLILLVSQNKIEAIAGYRAFLEKQAVPLMVSDKITKEAIAALAKMYAPDLIWIPEGCHGLLVGVDGNWHCVHKGNDYSLYKNSLIANRTELHPDLALLLPTSGSTGSPKYVRLSRKNIENNAASIVEYLGLDESDRSITTLPFSYSYGVSIINSHLSVGASVVLTDASLMSRDFWSLLQEKEATNINGVPYTYQMLSRLKLYEKDLPYVRFLTQAGGRLGKELQEEFASGAQALRKKFYVMYGQTEATARMAYLQPELCLEKLGSIGQAIPGGELRLAAVDGGWVSNSEQVGELVYFGSNVSMGYAESRDDLRLGDQNKGCLYTGDLAYRDVDSCYYISGRLKRFLKVFGNRVNLDDLEGVLLAKGITAACSGTDEAVCVYVEDADAKEVTRMLTEATGFSHSAFDVVTCGRLPRNEAGKILYSVLE